MLLTAHYDTIAALAVDVRDQLERGGLLIKTQPPPGLELFASVQVAVECAASAVVVRAQVLQIFPGLGVAVGFDADARARIDHLIAAAGSGPSLTVPSGTLVPPVVAGPRAAAPDPPADVAPEPLADAAPEPPADAAPADAAPADAAGLGDTIDDEVEGWDDVPTGNLARRPMASTNEKIQQALHGDRDQRLAIMRDRNRNLHAFLLRNPGITLDEISAMARMHNTSVDALRQIAERRDWGRRPEIAIALLRNPSLPPPIAIPLLDFVTPLDLKQLAKDTRTRDPIQRAARKKLLR